MLPALIIYGTRTSPCRAEEGSFVCPCCNMQRTFHLMNMKRWFTLYFLPVLPIGSAGEYVECKSCGGTYGVEVLSMGPNQTYATRFPNKQTDPSLIIWGVMAGLGAVVMIPVFLIGLVAAVSSSGSRSTPTVASTQQADLFSQPDFQVRDDPRERFERLRAEREARMNNLRPVSGSTQPGGYQFDPPTFVPPDRYQPSTTRPSATRPSSHSLVPGPPRRAA